jgi:hypothetical protein
VQVGLHLREQLRLQQQLPQPQTVDGVLLHDPYDGRWEVGPDVAEPARDVRRGPSQSAFPLPVVQRGQRLVHVLVGPR